MSWDSYFLDIAQVVATKSKDPSTKVGAVLVRDKTIVGLGFNGFPRGIEDTPERYADREIKYKLICHGEHNAILNCAREGIRTVDATLYITPLFPCATCALYIIQAGIKEVVCRVVGDQSRWIESQEIATTLLYEAGVKVTWASR